MSDALHQLVVCADIERSGSIRDTARPAVREGLHSLFISSLTKVGVGPLLYHKEDRGDGVLVLVEPSVPKARLLGRWILEINEQLRELNQDRRRPVRLRLGLHCGEVRRDGAGVSGKAIDLTFRLTDSDVARETLAEAPDATLVVIVSDWLFTDVVAGGGPYIESRGYRRVRVTGRSVDADAWVYVPRIGVPTGDAGNAKESAKDNAKESAKEAKPGTEAGTEREPDGARPVETDAPAEPACAQAAAGTVADERRTINTEVYNKIGRIDRVAVLGVVKNSSIRAADDE
ncbi:hypothetical protein KGA66_03055 [Actinocrinis puniceicyclus]|uniref:Guanylate cyclase domain-containing protein n=1 Tax=Actinocrinis puniceicyclus TaxID=977794 RepID=A0A8J7WGU3_9ACTN|nr:hypothetical protein [Actinocrinis puniceicyclus]MBS2962011.1 hypothetical protein [Actinocrinis puniceicyclus]